MKPEFLPLLEVLILPPISGTDPRGLTHHGTHRHAGIPRRRTGLRPSASPAVTPIPQLTRPGSGFERQFLIADLSVCLRQLLQRFPTARLERRGIT